MTPITTLLNRLFKACGKLPINFGGNVWQNGVNAIERKRNVKLYLHSFKPHDMTLGEKLTMTVVVTVKEKVKV